MAETRKIAATTRCEFRRECASRARCPSRMSRSRRGTTVQVVAGLNGLQHSANPRPNSRYSRGASSYSNLDASALFDITGMLAIAQNVPWHAQLCCREWKYGRARETE